MSQRLLKHIFVLACIFIFSGCRQSIPEDKSSLEKERKSKVNSLFVIAPYKYEGSWVFDDANAGLTKEPFVSGADTIIDKLVSDIPDADKGFRLLFSAFPFPGYSIKLKWIREEYDGNWYYCEKYKMEGWLCPSLFKYFDSAPREIYAKAEPKK